MVDAPLTNLPRFQDARPDHVRVESSSCCFPRELDYFDPWHVTRYRPIVKRSFVVRYNNIFYSFCCIMLYCVKLCLTILIARERVRQCWRSQPEPISQHFYSHLKQTKACKMPVKIRITFSLLPPLLQEKKPPEYLYLSVHLLVRDRRFNSTVLEQGISTAKPRQVIKADTT